MTEYDDIRQKMKERLATLEQDKQKPSPLEQKVEPLKKNSDGVLKKIGHLYSEAKNIIPKRQKKQPSEKSHIAPQGKWKRRLKKAALVAGITGTLAVTSPVTVPFTIAAVKPEEERILNARENLESDVRIQYSNGQTFDSLGSTKLRFLEYEELPPTAIVAAIAAEDRNFRDHSMGQDYKGLARAIIKYVPAKLKGQRPAGGSSIQVQTAKQLWGGEKTTGILDKIDQFVDARRMMTTFDTTDEILALYLNSMQVKGGTGQGGSRGFAEAAYYYFQKEPEELDEIETMAIIATLKGAGVYQPFLKTRDSFETKMGRQKDRMLYMARAMKAVFQEEVTRARENLEQATKAHAAGTFSEEGLQTYQRIVENFEHSQQQFNERYDEILKFLQDPKTKIPFRNGERNYSKSSLVAMIDEEYQSLAKQGSVPEELQPGTRIITSLDADMQPALQYYLRRKLNQVTVQLEGYKAPPEVKSIIKTVAEFRQNGFQFGRITEVNEDSLVVDFGNRKATVTREGLEEMVKADWTHKNGLRPFDENYFERFIEKLSINDLVYTSVRELPQGEDAQEHVTLNLEVYPPGMQAAAVFIGKENGILAAVGNAHDKGGALNYIHKGKQPGSGMKPFVYLAAIEEGWEITGDNHLLKNAPRIFPFGENQTQRGQPDEWKITINPKHMGPAITTIWGATTHSENFATAMIYESMFDKLTPEQFLEKTRKLNYTIKDKDGNLAAQPFGIKEDEDSKTYERRMKNIGIKFEGWREPYKEIAQFKAAKKRILSTLTEDERPTANLIDYGYKYEVLVDEIVNGTTKRPGITRYQEKLAHATAQWEINHYEKVIAELKEHLPLTKLNYRYLTQTLPKVESTILQIKQAHQARDQITFDSLVSRYIYTTSKGTTFSEDELPAQKASTTDLFAMQQADLESLLNINQLWINDLIKVGTVKTMQAEVEKAKTEDPYSFEIISQHPDFTFGIAQAKLKDTLKKLGLTFEDQDKIFPPSFALGSKEITPYQLALAYRKMIDPDAEPYLIAKVINARGKIIYERTIEKNANTLEPSVLKLLPALEGVTTDGTTSFMRKPTYYVEGEEVIVEHKQHPFTAGKTGTTNSAKEATFSGLFADSLEEQVEIYDLGGTAVMLMDNFGRENMYHLLHPNGVKPKLEAKGMGEIYGSGTAGAVVSETLKTKYPIKNDLVIPGATYEVVNPRDGLLVDPESCDVLDEEKAYCKRGTEVKGLGRIFVVP